MLKIPVSGKRQDILEWLKDPPAHFPRRRRGHLVEDGVTAASVAGKLGVRRSVAQAHLDVLTGIGLLRAKKVRWRTYYSRDEFRIAEVARVFEKGW